MRPKESYFVCYTPRSGSTMFCEALGNTGVAGHPEEYFEAQPHAAVRNPIWTEGRRTLAPEQFLERIYEQGSTPNGVFGSKLLLWHVQDLGGIRKLPIYGNMPLFEVIRCIFPNPRFIWVTRRDKVRQAVSLYKATLTNMWTSENKPEISAPSELVFNFQFIESLLRSIVIQEAAWADLFTRAGIAPMTVTYEDLVVDSLPTVRRTLEYLNIEVPADLRLPPPRFDKQADALSEQWTSLYYRRDRRRYLQRAALNLPSVTMHKPLRRIYLRPALRRWMTRWLAPFGTGHRNGLEGGVYLGTYCMHERGDAERLLQEVGIE